MPYYKEPTFLFFEVMHFHCAMNFKGRNVGLELDFKDHIKENDEIL
jgi:hypothetical protein